MNDDGHDNHEARILLVWTLAQMDLRLAEIERTLGVYEKWQFTTINELARAMDLPPRYDRIEAAAKSLMTNRNPLRMW